MNAGNVAPPALSMLAFGDVGGNVWGAAWIADPVAAEPGLLMLGVGNLGIAVTALPVRAGTESEEWRLGDDSVGLVASPVGDAVPVHDAENTIEGYDQMCRVSGRWVSDGAEHEIDCLGVRTWLAGAADLSRFESIRAVCTWFEPDEALTLMAFRARKAKGHGTDVIAAAVIGPDRATVVEDPRLSTTYEAGGWPVRAGLELWLPAEESSEPPYPRRASGEATGARAEGTLGEINLRAEPLRWHSRGRDGAGIYILARRR